MNVYMLSVGASFFNLNEDLIVSSLQKWQESVVVPKVYKLTDISQYQLYSDDIVLVGLDENDVNMDWLNEQVEILQNKGVKPVLCTPWNYYDLHTNESYFKSRKTIKIKQLVNQLQLSIIDLASFSSAWYLTLSETEVTDKLELISGSNHIFTMNRATQFEELTEFIVNWLGKYLAPNQLGNNYYYGASMYPEVWNLNIYRTDIQRAKDAGMNVIRIGEFFWDKLEPKANEYKLDYLEELLKIATEEEMEVILGIPSPTPPRWFTVMYPNSKIINQQGDVEEHGSRQHVCTNFLKFREKIYQLTQQIGQTVNKFDNVIALQIDNEYKCHVDLCYCESCTKLWPNWLAMHYGTIEKLNEKWGTDVWSERYDTFEDIVLPTKTPFIHNSALMNAFREFTSDTLNDMATGTAQILTSVTKIPITHNSALGFNLQNQALFSQLDIVGFDTYIPHDQYWGYAMNLNLWRNMKNSDEFLLLETSTSHVGHLENYVTPHPKNYLQTEVFLGYAAGLKSFLYWPFRGQPVGVEQTHSAVLTTAGTPDLGYEDVISSGQNLRLMEPLLKNTYVVKSSVAIIYSDTAKRFYNIETGGIYQYRALVTDFYHSLVSRGVSVELVPETADLTNYKCILVPFVRNIPTHLLDKLQRLESDGGKVIYGPMSGDRTSNLTWQRENGLGELGEYFEIHDVIQYLSQNKNTELRASYKGITDEFTGLVTVFKTDKLKEVTLYTDIVADYTILARQNNSIYLGALPKNLQNSPFWDKFVADEIKPFDKDNNYLTVGNGIIKYRRENKDNIQFYLANMSDTSSKIHLMDSVYDIKNDQYLNEEIDLEKYQTLILQISKNN